MISRWSNDQQSFQNARHAGAIRYLSRSNGADEIAAKTTILFDLIAVTCPTLMHILVDSSLGVAIAIVHGNHEGHRRGQLQRQRLRTSSQLGRRLLRRIIVSFLQNLYTGGIPASTETKVARNFKANWPCTVSAAKTATDYGLFEMARNG